MTVDVTQLLDDYTTEGRAMMFEGAQGMMLDIDHGTYPYVTSSNTSAGAAAAGGVGAGILAQPTQNASAEAKTTTKKKRTISHS